MNNKISIILIAISSILFSDSFEVNSPDKNLKFKLSNNNGSIVYSIHKKNETVINDSSLGFMFANKPDFYQNLSLSNSSTSSFSETWEQPWGENRYVLNNYNELAVDITDTNNRTITFRVRAYNEGIGFRYEFPNSFIGDELIIQDELTS
ncbi:MAG: glycoside hydrolase family 97 N-terminal domain-containing protein, partial [Proteobacteria bacterium]|nr:glycoside hydrolase family 97 N-terminal domain-containing protein [Pseudomonadota bacterium]